MKTVHRLNRFLPACIVVAVAVMVLQPGEASALFSGSPSTTAGMTAATISAPGSFTATAGTKQATLSWTAPPARTGYTLSGPLGDQKGSCAATVAANVTTCTVTGLQPNHLDTWTLIAVYNNWTSPSVQASTTPTP